VKVIIAGSRTITNFQYVRWVINRSFLAREEITEIVSGHCLEGVDKLGEKYAETLDIPLKLFPADWNKYGRAAGPIRNKLMAKYADVLVAIWDGKSRGTKNMISEMKKLKKKIALLDLSQADNMRNKYKRPGGM